MSSGHFADFAPEPYDAEELLRVVEHDTLLTTLLSLTHAVRATEDVGRDASNLRAQRDLVRSEVLRRMGA